MRYQVYEMDFDDKVVGKQALDCLSDDDAIERAGPAGAAPVEVWQGRRFVCRITPRRLQARPEAFSGSFAA
jgi:hypothetical protein